MVNFQVWILAKMLQVTAYIVAKRYPNFSRSLIRLYDLEPQPKDEYFDQEAEYQRQESPESRRNGYGAE